jgi:hypothetical protein
LLQNVNIFFSIIEKYQTTCFGLYSKAIFRLYKIVEDLFFIGGWGGDEISPYKLCVGVLSTNVVVAVVFSSFLHSCLDFAAFVVTGVVGGREAGVVI